MSKSICRVCGSQELHLIYEGQSASSLTSLGQIYPGLTRVFVCHACAHLQTDEMENLAEYYDQHYNILVESEEEDQIYEIRGGVPLYRTAHQVTVLQSKIQLPVGARILDYGCAKSSTMQALLQVRPDLHPHFFDVSERYQKFWASFAQPQQWAVYRPHAEWASRFDAVTSFFSLEHMAQPLDELLSIRELIKPDGLFYAVVPNVLSNIADFIVVDHVNHFTQSSLGCLLQLAGFAVLDIDAQVHRGAFVIVARRDDGLLRSPTVTASAVSDTLEQLKSAASFWQEAAQRIQTYAADLPWGARCVIYGAGFYGAFIAACLPDEVEVLCFIDQNPHLQGRSLNGRQVMSAQTLPEEANTLLVGLNPAHARQIIAEVPELHARVLRYFYL